MVCLRLRIYWPDFKRDGQPLRLFLLVFLIFPRASLFNFARSVRMVIIGTQVFICFILWAFPNEFLRSDFLQLSFKIYEIISILMLRRAITVFVYISFPASIKMFWLVTCPTNSGQKYWPAQFRTLTGNSKSRRLFRFRHQARSSWFLPKQYLTSLRMCRTNVP